MITYKGQKTVIGKRFLLEGKTVKYLGKIYGDKHILEADNIQYILTENELDNLLEYEKDNAESNLVKNIGNNDELKKLIISYTEKELNLLSDLISGKSDDKKALNDYYQKEVNELSVLNRYDLPKTQKDNISLEAQQSFLNDINRNVSDTNVVALISSLLDFIASNNKGDEKNGDIQ